MPTIPDRPSLLPAPIPALTRRQLGLSVLAGLGAGLPACGSGGGDTEPARTPAPTPGPPPVLQVRLVPGALGVSWQAAHAAEEIELQWRPENEPAWTHSRILSGRTARIESLRPAQAYAFRARARGADAADPRSWSVVRVRTFYTLSLPVLDIDTDGQPILTRTDYVPARITIEPNGHDLPFHAGELEIRGRGNSTWLLPKKPYRLRLGTRAPLLNMPSDRHWVLLANGYDPSHLRNHTAFALSGRTDLGWTPRTRPVEVVLDGEYQGLYQLGEHVRVAAARIDIEAMDSNDVDGEALTGGYLYEIDTRMWENNEPGFATTRYGLPIVIKDPDPATAEQTRYSQDLFAAFEATLAGTDFADPLSGFRAHLDAGTLLDSYLVAELTRQQDAFKSSTFMVKPRGAAQKLRLGPLWDFDLSMGTQGPMSTASPPEGWFVRLPSRSPWLARMLEDPVFAAEVRARWETLKAAFAETIDHLPTARAELENAASQDALRWNYGVEAHDTVEGLQAWLRTRWHWLDTHL